MDKNSQSFPGLLENPDISARYLAAEDLKKLSDEEVLEQTLDVNAIISTSSSFARRPALEPSPELQRFNQIGEGLQGAIFERVGHHFAVKKEKPGNEALPSNLRHEYSIHNQVMAAFDKYSRIIKCRVQVPRPSDIILSSDDDFWSDNRFPDGYRDRSMIVAMERILPLPKVVRRALVTQFYPRQSSSSLNQATINEILNDPPNKHCLVRVYLGKDEMAYKREGFSLRNFPLCLNSMERLGLDVKSLASSMGQAYAIMHWGAGVDGDDVEFVLGTAEQCKLGVLNNANGLQQRAVGLFLLDFGQCEMVDLSLSDPSVVYQAFKGAMVTGDNQLFIPHYRGSPELFAVFKRAYIDAAEAILDDKKLGGKFDVLEFIREYEEYAEDFLA